jgi:hypothetical protein
LYVAVCVDLTLAAQADSMDEVKRKLDEQIHGYLHDIFNGEDKQHIKDLFPRRAPMNYIARYQWIRLLCKIDRVIFALKSARAGKWARNPNAQAFNEFWPEFLAN